MGGKTSRTKGHSFERWIAKQFRSIGCEDARRELEYQEARGVDVNAGPFAIQSKAYKDYCPISKINEIQDDKKINLLVTKGDRKEPMVVLKFSVFLKLISYLFK